jgi:hypothetical protein
MHANMSVNVDFVHSFHMDGERGLESTGYQEGGGDGNDTVDPQRALTDMVDIPTTSETYIVLWEHPLHQ